MTVSAASFQQLLLWKIARIPEDFWKRRSLLFHSPAAAAAAPKTMLMLMVAMKTAP